MRDRGDGFDIDAVPPDCQHWNFQLDNWWMESLDHSRRITVNKHTATTTDGRLTIVVAERDPGWGNWIDTAGHSSGTALLRWLGAPALLAMIGALGTLRVYDVSGEAPVMVAEQDVTTSGGCADGAMTADAARLVTACENSPGHGVFRTADLSKISALYEGSGQANAGAIAPGDRYVAAGPPTLDGETDRSAP